MSARRLALTAVDGQLTVRDGARPGARLVRLELADGRSVRVAEHLCGWLAAGDERPLWRQPADARAAFADEGDHWFATLHAAASLAPHPGPSPLPAEEDAALQTARERHPGAWIDGPLRSPDGGWQMVLSGNSDLGWLVARADTPLRAAQDLLEQISARENDVRPRRD